MSAAAVCSVGGVPGQVARSVPLSLQVLQTHLRCAHRHDTHPALNANSVKQALAPVSASDALPVSDAGRCHRPAAAVLGIRRETVNRSAGERVRGAMHIQTAISHHSQFKGFLRPFRGVATKCLDSCLRWFHLVALGKHPASRACLAAASARTCLQIVNEPL